MPSRPGPHGNPASSAIRSAASAAAAAGSHRPSNSQSSLLCGSHRTTTVAHQPLPFVTAADGASRGWLWALTLTILTFLSSYQNMKSELIANPESGAARYITTFPWITFFGEKQQPQSHGIPYSYNHHSRITAATAAEATAVAVAAAAAAAGAAIAAAVAAIAAAAAAVQQQRHNAVPSPPRYVPSYFCRA